MNRHALTDEQWSIVNERLPQRRGPKSEKTDRRFVEAVVWIARTGVPWRDLDAQFGSWKSIYNRFRNWARRGWWADVFRGCKIQEEVASIMDASIVRAHQDAAGGRGGPEVNEIGRSRGGFSTKLHAVVTLDGKPIEIRLTPGQRHEATVAEDLLPHPQTFPAHRDPLRQDRGMLPFVPPRGLHDALPLARADSKQPV